MTRNEESQGVVKIQGEGFSREVKINGKLLSPVRSQKVFNHSPDSFAWGYGGSGPAQLSLAILLECVSIENMPKESIRWAKKILVEKWPEFEEKFNGGAL